MSSLSHFEGEPEKFISIEKDEKGKEKKNVFPGSLNIVWGNDRRYFKQIVGESPAELIQVSWLEITGSVTLKPENMNKKYQIGFKVELTPDAFGWNNSPVYIMGKMGNKPIWTKLNLTKDSGKQFEIPEKPLVVEPQFGDSDNKIYFGLYEVWSGKWKGGLKIHSAFVKEFVPDN